MTGEEGLAGPGSRPGEVWPQYDLDVRWRSPELYRRLAAVAGESLAAGGADTKRPRALIPHIKHLVRMLALDTGLWADPGAGTSDFSKMALVDPSARNGNMDAARISAPSWLTSCRLVLVRAVSSSQSAGYMTPLFVRNR